MIQSRSAARRAAQDLVIIMISTSVVLIMIGDVMKMITKMNLIAMASVINDRLGPLLVKFLLMQNEIF